MLHFNDITLLITHYNRSKSLENLLFSLANFQISFANIVVSDDGSNPQHFNYVQNLAKQYPMQLITTPVNKGLGNNINKGQDAIKTSYTLYIQEDFVIKSLFAQKLSVAHQFMQQDLNLDMVRFYAYFKYPNLKPISDGFSEIIFNQFNFFQGYRKFYVYSDHPHLRRNNFFEKFGRYDEGIKPDRTEYNMMMKVLAKKPKVYFYENITELINQENSVAEPSTIKRNFWRNSNNHLIQVIRIIYRYLRFNLDLIIYKLKR
jgi:glycosyltransferase involved in cell wall biosynthesis